MIGIEPTVQVYLAPGATDMRKSIDGLASMVSNDTPPWGKVCLKRRPLLAGIQLSTDRLLRNDERLFKQHFDL